MKYSKQADRILNKIKIQTSWRWVIDETVVKVAGGKYWLWDVINARDRFLLATHLTVNRGMRSAMVLLYEAKRRTIGKPKVEDKKLDAVRIHLLSPQSWATSKLSKNKWYFCNHMSAFVQLRFNLQATA
jgi:hypothetical protein